MIEINKTVIVPASNQEMFELVADIDNYPNILPWCSKTTTKIINDKEVIGSIFIEYLKIKTHFITKNINTPFSRIDIALIEGPFHNLFGYWEFIPLGNEGCKINFFLKYQFSNFLLEKAIGSIFNYISNNIIDCFVKEAYARKYK